MKEVMKLKGNIYIGLLLMTFTHSLSTDSRGKSHPALILHAFALWLLLACTAVAQVFPPTTPYVRGNVFVWTNAADARARLGIPDYYDPTNGITAEALAEYVAAATNTVYTNATDYTDSQVGAFVVTNDSRALSFSGPFELQSGKLTVTNNGGVATLHIDGKIIGTGTNDLHAGATNTAWTATQAATNTATTDATNRARLYTIAATNTVLADSTNRAKAYTDSVRVTTNGFITGITRAMVTNALTGDITNNTTGNAATATSADRADQANVLFVVPGAFISKAADTTPFMSYSESGTNHLTIGLPLYFGDMIFAWDSDAGLLRIIDYGDDGAVSIDNGAFYGLFDGGGSAITNLNADNLASGTVPLARLSGITSNELAAATDTIYRQDSNAVVTGSGSISVSPSTTGQVATYTVSYTGGSGAYDINENDTHTVTSDTHMVPWSISVADGEVIRIEFFATAKGTASDCWGTLSYVGYWRRDGATMSAITMSDERNHYNKGAGLDVFVVDDTSTANTVEIRAQAASGTPSVRVMVKGHVVRNAGP